MKTFANLRLILIIVLLLSATVSVIPQQSSVQPEWIPPSPRPKALTLFAPKPIGGDNIFKGEAEVWLADAIEKIEADALIPIKDKSVSDYVSQVGKNLAKYSVKPDKNYEFIVLNDEEENAMNVGGGRIYINLGMLKSVESEDELAGILAHEIGHDAFGHAAKTVTRQLFWMKGIRKVKTPEEVKSALETLDEAYEKNLFAAFGESLLGFSRFNELEADRAAFYNIYKAGYNPSALISVMNKFEREEKKEMGKNYGAYQFLTFLFGSHPPTAQRSTAFSWESNFVKMPPKDARYKNPAFDAMKAKAAKL
ncbi:MAG: M48 family metallopeptidase [Pyrinomonadaceae bacterium]